jgi:hypothetical protein
MHTPPEQSRSKQSTRRVARKIFGEAIHLCLATLIAVPAFTQIDRTGLSGTAKDSSSKVLPGVHIIAREEETGLERDTSSSSNGSYYIPELPIGVYTVTFTHEGFERFCCEV